MHWSWVVMIIIHVVMRLLFMYPMTQEGMERHQIRVKVDWPEREETPFPPSKPSGDSDETGVQED